MVRTGAAAILTEAVGAAPAAGRGAPTGTGKSQGYLIPAAKYAIERPGSTLVVATGTKALQDQLAAVDVPLVTELFQGYGHELRIVELKGRHNYVCRHELDELATTRQAALDAGQTEDFFLRNQFQVPEDRDAYLQIRHWTKEAVTGDLAVAPVAISESLKRQITRSSQRCHRQECDFYDDCFSFVRKAEAAKAHIIIVNYALLMADLNLRENSDGFANVIPLPMTKLVGEPGDPVRWVVNFERVSIIADEAHEMEGFARDAFTVEATHRGILYHVAQVAAMAYKHKGYAAADDDDDEPAPVLTFTNGATVVFGEPPADVPIDKSGRTQLKAVEQASHQVFEAYRKQLDPRGRGGEDAERDQLLGDELETMGPLIKALTDLGNYLAWGPPSWITERAERLDWGKLLERSDELTVTLKRLANPLEKGAKNYVRTAKLKGKAVTLEAVRIDVAPVLRKLLWDPFRAVVATSATLTAKDGFASFRRRLGANANGRDFARDDDGAIRLLEVPSPFDYPRIALLFTPPDAADHDPRAANGNREGLENLRDWWADWMYQLVQASLGGAFLLFTSRADTMAVYERLERDFKDFPMYVQETDANPGRLVHAFRESQHSVLFGVRSCWQGLDVPGPALRLVVINRMPMPALDPLFKARQQLVKARGGNDFVELSLYEATTLTKQGFGRLHRRTTDQGVVALLDSRHQTMPYGREMLDLLPPARRTASVAEVQDYFAAMRGEGSAVQDDKRNVSKFTGVKS